MKDRPVDLRVDDHADPVRELRRLVALAASYHRIEVADELAAAGDVDGALEEYAAAHTEQPGNAELAFWHGVTLAASGREQEARELLQQAYREGEGWRELLRRLPASRLFPDDRELIERLVR
jgi:uncharacterized Ntn-hydrolase superfamily protein